LVFLVHPRNTYELCLDTNYTYELHGNKSLRQTPMPLVGFEPTVSEGERSQTHARDRAFTGVGNYCNLSCYNFNSHTEENHINACKDRQSLAGD